MSFNNRVNAYKETQIKTAGQGKMIVMVYDEAIRQLDRALSCLESEKKHHKLDVVNNSILKTQDLITELMVSLDFDKGGEIAHNLFSLYVFFNQKLMEANIQKDHEPIALIRKQLSELRGAWYQIMNKASASGSGGGVNIAG